MVSTRRQPVRALSGLILVMAVLCSGTARADFAGFVAMTNGYFVDTGTGKPFIPHGIAYQTWNRPLGVWQTWDQINYDLDEMVKMGANSIRVDFVWQHIEEDGDNQFEWANYDYLVQECEKRNIRLFALIGYQWPPNWFPDDWYTMHPPETDASGILHTNRWQSDIIGYETPAARAQYAEWISNVCARFKDSKAIAGWIVGNESGYLGLWSGLLDGYDTNCETAFRAYCQTHFTNIAVANARWGTTYTNFNQIVFVDQYRAYGVEGAIWADMVQWREDSIADFTALGARAAKFADTNHLISYSTVGMQWGEEDWRYHAEDRGRITEACEATNAPIDFFSVNNYPWAMLGHESQNGHWGISFTKKVAKVPVLYSETGFTSSETMWPGMNADRQGPLIRNSLWESLEVGAIGTHIFSWMDRPYITDREKGFGIVYPDRGIKPAYWVNRDTFNLMEQMRLGDLLMGSQDPKPDIAFLWTDAADSQYNRYECEMQQIAGALERIGYEPNFINLAELGADAYTNFRVVILPRNMRVEDVVPNSTNTTVLDFLRTRVIPAGVHVIASADIPGMQNFNGKPRAQFVDEVKNLFGVDPSDAGGFETPMRTRHYVTWYWRPISIGFTTNAVTLLTNNFSYRPIVWKYNDEVTVTNGGVVWATMDTERNKGFEGSSSNVWPWEFWEETNYVASDVAVVNNPGWQYSGSNVVRISGDAGIWDATDIVPFGRYAASTWLRCSAADPLRDGSYASLSIEWYGESGRYLGMTETTHLVTNTPGDAWVKFAVDDLAPSNAYVMRRVLRVGHTNLLANPGLTGGGVAPAGWQNWNDTEHDPNTVTYLGTSGNSWQFTNDAGLYQDITNGFVVGETLTFGGRLYTPGADALRDGTKRGAIELEFYDGVTLMSVTQASPRIDSLSAIDTWHAVVAKALVPTGATSVRILVRSDNGNDGDGRFFADDLFVRNASRAGGSVYADNLQRNPAMVVKDHGAAKAAIFLYSVGDNSPDTGDDPDDDPDIQPWHYRYNIFASLIRDYFGVQPSIMVLGTNSPYCLPEYRTTTNGSIFIQMKNYLYDTSLPGGGSSQTFVVQSSMLTGRTIRAYDQGRIVEINCDGEFWITLPPDGNEMLLAYTAAVQTNNLVVQISDAPSVVHPFGDKVYTLKVKYDAGGQTGLVVKIAFRENGDNGDGVTNEIYQVLTNSITGNGEQWFFMWIPDPDQSDTDYISTTDGGNYVFEAWIENGSGQVVAQVDPQPATLEWGIRFTNSVPTNIVKGQTLDMPVEWEDLYEQLSWQATPMTRNDAYPGRVAVYRSTKTDAQYTGHLARANQACDWLDSLGYESGNPLDIAFDNVTVAGLMSDDFNDGDSAGWSRIAGAANWTVEGAGVGTSFGNSSPAQSATTYALDSATKRLSFRLQADASKTVDTVSIYGRIYGTGPTYRVDIQTDSTGKPSGVAIATQTFTVTTTNYAWQVVDLPDVAWQAGQTYHVVIYRSSGAVNASNCLRVQYVGPDDGAFRTMHSQNSGATWTLQSYGATFRIGYEDGTSMGRAYMSATTLDLFGQRQYGQLVAPPVEVTVTNVSIYARKENVVDGDLLLTVRTWTNKALVATSLVSRTLISTNNTWINFPFPSQPVLGTGDVYVLELRSLASTGSYLVCRANTPAGSGVYSWGSTNSCAVYSANAGRTHTLFADSDLDFTIQGAAGHGGVLRAWRIGNDDNLFAAGSPAWTDRVVSVDIRYNDLGYYFRDAEVYVRFVDRNNYIKVGIQDYYGFWRLKYTVRVNGHVDQTGWLLEFPKTNAPVAGTWYTLAVESKGSTNTVTFDGAPAGSFISTNFPAARIALGSRAAQLGIWEPKQGYYFIDDDENGNSADPNTNGPPLNLDWGYLNQFFRTLVLPSVYVMNDAETSNMVQWAQLGMNGLIAMDGGVAMKNESGAADLGRVENLFGVGAAVGGSVAGLASATIGTDDHYVTLDYPPGAQVAVTGAAMPYVSLTRGTALATLAGTGTSYGVIVNTITNNPAAPGKTVVFNFGADTGGQLLGSVSNLGRRAFEWSRGQANKVTVELKYRVSTTNPSLDVTIYTTNAWVVNGSGSTNFVVNIPSDGIMTGDELYWVLYTHPWETTGSNAWLAHNGFYSSGNEGIVTVLPGKGLQVLGVTENAYAGRDWDMWVAYNTRSSVVTMTYGVKDADALQYEDNFNDTNYVGWTVAPTTNSSVSAFGGVLQASRINASTQYVYITADNLNVTGRNITIEYDVTYLYAANAGGVLYRGAMLDVSPSGCGWQDDSPFVYMTNRPVIGTSSHVAVHIRDGNPYLMSDLYVNGKPVFVSEPIEVSSFSTGNTSIGLACVFPGSYGQVTWDNVRVADEQYSMTYTNVNGTFIPGNPTNPTVWPSVPDYDPDMWEHEGTTLGGRYEWFIYGRGEGLHSYVDANVYFSPRFQVELSSFPTNLSEGTNVVVPVEWEQLAVTQLPARLRVRLFDAFSGTIYVEKTATVSAVSGSTNIAVTIPIMPAGSNYVWSAFIYPTNASNPWVQRAGSDDTFRFNEVGIGLEPETRVTMTAAPVTGGTLAVYSDAGSPPGSATYTWSNGGSFNGSYNDATAPEGTMSFQTVSPVTYAGWGVFLQTNMTAYSNGYLKFWVKSPATLKLDLETNPFAKQTVYLSSTTNNWLQQSIAITNFSSLNLANMYGLFEITIETAGTFYIDDVKWSLDP